MKYSVIIPVYKVEKYLSECVESILSQDYQDYEIILVDDGSPDRCPEICDEYARVYPQISVLHQANAGLACARNAGLDKANGEYIIFIDSDDYLISKSALSIINSALGANTDVLVYGFKKYFESSRTYGNPICNFPDCADGMKPSDFLMALLKNDAYTGTAWVVKKSLLKDNHIEFKNGMISEDIDWYLQIMLKAQSYAVVNEALYVYRMRSDSISHAVKEKSLTDNLWIKENWPARIQKAPVDDKLKEVLMHIMARYMGNFMILYASYNRQIRKKYHDRVKELLYIFDYAVTPRAKKIDIAVKVLGLRLTTALLVIANKLKKRT